MFDTLKNTLGAMAYHFWSQYLSRASRKPKKNKDQEQNSTNPTRTNNTLTAIGKFVNVQLLVLGMLQLIAKQFPAEAKTTQKQGQQQESCLMQTYDCRVNFNNLKNSMVGWVTCYPCCSIVIPAHICHSRESGTRSEAKSRDSESSF